jgi:hypothetical protein
MEKNTLVFRHEAQLYMGNKIKPKSQYDHR